MNGVKGHPLGPSFAVAAAGLHRRHPATGAPRVARKFSTAAASSSPRTRACFPPALPSCSLQKFYSKVFAGVATLLLSQPSLHKVAGLNSLHFGRQPQHNIYKLVPADVIRYKNLIQRCSWAYHSRPSSKPTRKPPPRKSSFLLRVVQSRSPRPPAPRIINIARARAEGTCSLCQAKAMSTKLTSKGVPIGMPFLLLRHVPLSKG